MIGLIQNDERYDYDIRTLLQAFYENEKIVPARDNTRMQLTVTFQEEGEHQAVFQTEDGSVIKRSFSGDYRDKMLTRNTVKEAIYSILCEACGHTLPWGTLTGIRPVKIITGYLEQGCSEQEALARFKKDYVASDQKAELSLEVAKKEQEILKGIDYDRQYSLYIGIPFCPSRCLYCSFTSYPLTLYEEYVDTYLSALFREIDFAKDAMKGRHVNSIYIGGGTPTSLTAGQLNRLLHKIEASFDLSYMREFTVEAGRPDSITRDKLAAILESPATRISINPQTMNDQTLKLIGRNHTVEQVKETFYLAREMGFDNINMDLIMGLLGENEQMVAHTLSEIEALSPDNLTIHSLAIKRAANLNTRREEYEHVARGTTNEMLLMADRTARTLSMKPYYLYRQKNIPGNFENVGYARTGKEGIYNILIMEEKQTILALGAGAASKYVFGKGQRIERTENVKDVKLYVERIDEMIKRKCDMLESM